jgi:hypothetical protein
MAVAISSWHSYHESSGKVICGTPTWKENLRRRFEDKKGKSFATRTFGIEPSLKQKVIILQVLLRSG